MLGNPICFLRGILVPLNPWKCCLYDKTRSLIIIHSLSCIWQGMYLNICILYRVMLLIIVFVMLNEIYRTYCAIVACLILRLCKHMFFMRQSWPNQTVPTRLKQFRSNRCKMHLHLSNQYSGTLKICDCIVLNISTIAGVLSHFSIK